MGRKTIDERNRKRPYRPSVQRLFLERITREGKRKEFLTRVRAIRAGKPKSYGPSFWIAMREFGYTSAAYERKAAADAATENAHVIQGATRA